MATIAGATSLSIAALIAQLSTSLLTPTGDTSNNTVLSTGSGTARTHAARGADMINVKDGAGGVAGAKGDAAYSNTCTIAAASTTLTCAGAVFPSTLVGKTYYLQGTGAAGIPQTGTISSVPVSNGNTLVLSLTAVSPAPVFGIYNPPQGGVGISNKGSLYAVGDTVNLAGTGTQATLTVASTAIVAVTGIAAAGTGGTTGACVVTGTTGTGTKFTATGTIASGALQSGVALTTGGAYTVAVTAPANEPVTGCGLTGAALTLTGGGIAGITDTNPGAYTVYPGTSYAVTSTSGAGVGAAFTGTGSQMAGHLITCTDDTAALASVFTNSNGKRVWFPAGGYCVASQASSFVLKNVSVVGDGMQQYGYPFIQGGSWILPISQSVSLFSVQGGVTWDNTAIFYPLQDNTQAAPIAYPPTFTMTSGANNRFNRLGLINAYDGFYVPTNGAIGRFYMRDTRMFAVNRYFNLLNGFADVVDIDGSSYFGPGAYDSSAQTGPAMLGQAAETTGEFFHIDLSNAGYPLTDGLRLHSLLLQGERYGVRMVGTQGIMDVSDMTDGNYDAVQTILSIEGSASIVSSNLSGAEVYSTNIYDSTQANPVINFHGKQGASDLHVSKLHVSFAQGDIFADYGGARYLSIQNGQWLNFGKSTTLGAYMGFHEFGPNTGFILLQNNQISCARSGNPNTLYGMLTGTSSFTYSQFDVQNNTIISCTYPMVLQGAAGNQWISDNRSLLSGLPITDNTGSPEITTWLNNLWDLPPNANNPTLTGCGTGATVATDATNELGKITLGTGGVTTCGINWTATLLRARVCTVQLNTASITAAVTVPGATTATVAFSADASGKILSYSCPPN